MPFISRSRRWPSSIRLPAIDAFDSATGLLLALLVVLALATFKQYAVSNDEGLQHHYGELIIAYYKSGFADKSVFAFDNLYLYGGLFDIIAVLLAHSLPFDPYDIRHVMSALAGIGGVAATWATARAIAGPRAGLFAGLALALCGAWYGGMFNHTKDVPFAAAMMAATYSLLRTARDLPQPRWRDLIWFGIWLGCALGLRATGLLMVCYLGLVILLSACVLGGDWMSSLRLYAACLIRFAPALALAYLIMIAVWPWASLDFLNPARAIFAFAHFKYPIRTLLAGQVYLMNEVPRWYEPAYLAIKTPLVTLAGAFVAAWTALARRARASRTGIAQTHASGVALLAFTIAFPLACQVICDGPSFTGMRHFLFVVPPLAALGGIGIDAALTLMDARGRVAAAAAVLTVLTAFAQDAVALVQLHPYEYLFYNSLVGGLEGAQRRYETDYWVNIMPAAVQYLEAYVSELDRQAGRVVAKPYTVGVCGERVAFEDAADRRLQWTPDWSHADFFIAPTHMNCDQVLRGRVVDQIERVGVLIGVVKDLRGLSPQARWAPVEVAHAPASDGVAHTTPHG